MNTHHVLYEELCPAEFTKRLKKCPVAYLPLGTLEWHGPQLPLGADGIQSQALFEQTAEKIGGIVLPKLFLGPDRYYHDPNRELYGMDLCSGDALTDYPMQQLVGSAYWMPDPLFDEMLLQIARNLSRAGFRILVAHGHGPSTQHFTTLAEQIKDTTGLICISPWEFVEEKRLQYQSDHAAANETSITMAVRLDLVHMEYLQKESDQLAIAGLSPLTHASVEYGKEVLTANVEALSNGILQLLSEME